MRPRELYLTMRGILSLKDTELEDRSRISWPRSRRLWLWRRGFLTRSDILYDLDEDTVDDYLSDYQRFVGTRLINGTWSFALKNKLMCHWLMQPFDRHRMAIHGLLRNGHFHPIDRLTSTTLQVSDPVGGTTQTLTETDANRGPCEQVVARLESDSHLVLKWIHGGGGNNVLVCTYENGEYRINETVYSRNGFLERLRDLQDYLVCEYVDQHEFSSRLYPDAPNTIRILTMYDQHRGEPYVPAAIHRIGTNDSRPMDNFMQGGLSAGIDLTSGELGPAAQLTDDGQLAWHDVHPDTNTRIAGSRIPGWAEMLDRVRSFADLHAYIPYIGWDVIVAGEGNFTVIEANSYPGLHSIQAHTPLLADDRARQFYRDHDAL